MLVVELEGDELDSIRRLMDRLTREGVPLSESRLVSLLIRALGRVDGRGRSDVIVRMLVEELERERPYGAGDDESP